VAKNDKKSRENERRRKTWTVMVYMAAENNSELDAVAVEDLKEMERGVTENVHVVVQINRAWPAVPQRYEIRSSRGGKQGVSKFVDEDPRGTNMGKEETLTRFLTWAVPEFPADHYCLVLWGHAYGLGFGRDHGDALRLDELRNALHLFRKQRQQDVAPESGDGRLELLGTNACAMSYVEAAYELREHSEYLVASQIAVPYAGWPYELILSRLGSVPDAESLGQLVVNAYASHFNGLVAGERVTMSLLNLGALSSVKEGLALKGVDDFGDLIQKFADAIRDESRSNGPFGDRRAYVRDVFLAAASGDVRPLIDLEDLCLDFGDAESEELRMRAEAVRAFLPSFVVSHKGHPELVDELHGVGIFAPFVADDEDLRLLELQDEKRNGTGHKRNGHGQEKTGRQAYEGLELFKRGKAWPRLVYDELRQPAPSEFLASLTGLGADSPKDRRDINQIVLAIESSFNKLDRVLAEGGKSLDTELVSVTSRASSVQQSGPVTMRGAKRIGPPWLELISAPDVGTQVETLKQLLTLKAIEQAAAAPAGIAGARAVNLGSIAEPNIDLFALHPQLLDSMRSIDSALVDAAVDFLVRVEKAVREVERATRKGLTHARLGLGPMAPDRFTFVEAPKRSEGSRTFVEDDPKPGGPSHGFVEDDPKPGGPSHGSGGFPGGARDLRVDLAFARVVDLFGQVGQSLGQLEDATSQLENTARTALSNAESQRLTRADMLKAAGQGIRRALAMVEEASRNARLTIRGVLSHPVYGLGPGSPAIGLEEREVLANAGGLSRRNLRLL